MPLYNFCLLIELSIAIGIIRVGMFGLYFFFCPLTRLTKFNDTNNKMIKNFMLLKAAANTILHAAFLFAFT